jgi:type VI secretion system secreted protein Hcp
VRRSLSRQKTCPPAAAESDTASGEKPEEPEGEDRRGPVRVAPQPTHSLRRFAMATVDYFLKLDGIDGESQDDAHKNEIDVQSWSWSEQQSGSSAAGGGSGSGKVQMGDFRFTMAVNKATPKLMLACASGQHIAKGVLTCRKAGGGQQEYLKITLSDLIVSSYQTGGSASSDLVPVDQISLNYSKIEFEYKPQNPDGSLGGAIKAGWNLKTNTKT